MEIPIKIVLLLFKFYLLACLSQQGLVYRGLLINSVEIQFNRINWHGLIHQTHASCQHQRSRKENYLGLNGDSSIQLITRQSFQKDQKFMAKICFP